MAGVTKFKINNPRIVIYVIIKAHHVMQLVLIRTGTRQKIRDVSLRPGFMQIYKIQCSNARKKTSHDAKERLATRKNSH